MIFVTPELSGEETAVLALIAEQRDRLKTYVLFYPRRWFGSMRKSTFARAIQGSNSIEGFYASVEDAIRIIDDEPSMDERTETWYALKGYRDAMTYLMQAARDRYFELSTQFLKSLHFMMIGHEMKNNPGQWRPNTIFVVNQANGTKVYEGPPPEEVNGLVQELVEHLKREQNEPTLICAAMAHLNLTMIHPFSDGNGRMARALQTLVLARDGALHPVFSSIEEWLGRNTQEYYNVLAQVGQGEWKPGGDARPWIRFCLKAHFQQCATLIRRNEEYEKLFEGIQDLTKKHRLPDRVSLPLFDAALGMQLSNFKYRNDVDVTEFVASRDLRKLSELNLLDPKGEKRARTYTAAKELRDLRASVRIQRPLADPFDIVKRPGAVRSFTEIEEPRLPGF